MRFIFAAFLMFFAFIIHGSFALPPQPSFDVKAQVIKTGADNKMDIELLEVGKVVRPGLYGSFTREKFKVGDKLTVLAIIDKNIAVKSGYIIGGTLEKVTGPKGVHDELSNITVIQTSMLLYNLKRKFKSETQSFKTSFYGTE